MYCKPFLKSGTAALFLSLGACGGGGGLGSLASAPPPGPPPQQPAEAPPIPDAPIGLTGASSFATYSAYKDGSGALVSGPGGVQFAYSAADGVYTVTLPGFDSGTLVTAGGNGSFDSTGWTHLQSTFNHVTDGSSTALQPVNVTLDWPGSSDLRYTSFAQWSDSSSGLLGTFVYGIPTAAGDVPVTGSASYGGDIRGLTDTQLPVWGTISLSFDFGAGTLSGQMNPEYAPIWDAVSLGTYTFTNTIYSTGSTSFSGSFITPNGASGASSFQGSFNGPGAAELMGSWNAPFFDQTNNIRGNMSGVFGGKSH